MRLVSYLEFDGVEVANPNRVLTYLESLGDARITTSLDNCECDSLDTGPFATPDSDPAPWYDGTEASAQFLGIMLHDMRLTPPGRRAYSQRVTGGATVGPFTRAGRILQATGLMFAQTAAGMSFGERWLQDVLDGSTDGCADAEMRILATCGESLRTAQRVGLIDPPIFTPAATIPECLIQQVAFQLGAGSPSLVFNETIILAQQQLTGTKTACFTASLRTAAVVTVIAGSAAISDVDVFFEPDGTGVGDDPGYYDAYATDAYEAPQVGSMNYAEFRIESLAAGTTLVVDSAARTVEVRDSAGRLLGGYDALSWRGAWRWLESFNGARACVRVRSTDGVVNGATSVRIESVDID